MESLTKNHIRPPLTGANRTKYSAGVEASNTSAVMMQIASIPTALGLEGTDSGRAHALSFLFISQQY